MPEEINSIIENNTQDKKAGVILLKVVASLGIVAVICLLGFCILMAMACGGGSSVVPFGAFLVIAIIIGVSLIVMMFKKSPGQQSLDSSPLNNDQIALSAYVTFAGKRGDSKEEITALLKKNGWSEEDINGAFSIALPKE